jgi:hypothetical protein
MYQGFSWHAGLPRFLGGFLDLVFDRTSGVLFDDPSIDAILAVRQLTLLFSKVLLPCTSVREQDAMDGYVKCEQEVRESDSYLRDSDLLEFRKACQILYAPVLSSLDSDVYHGKLIPKHGPGATADKLMGNRKYQLRTWTERLEKYFPAMEFLSPSPSHYWEDYSSFHFLEPRDEMPVKVISVPKTQKIPRIIAIEPAAMQYAQQSILEQIVPRLESDVLLSGMIGFSDQGPNQVMARDGSVSGLTSTLDLSEASDRVSNQLVRTMMLDHPHLHGAVDASRSRRARVPGHGVVRLAKFASMGSALCFPMEAMVFLALVFLGISRELNTPLDQKLIKEYSDRVRVYGDDLIVPSDMVFSVINTLELFGARVGDNKSFWNGKFRESCGKEYYDGFDVSIVKVRRLFPTSRKDVPEVISLVSLRNQLYQAGYWGTTKWLDQKLERILKYFPYVAESSSVLGRYSFLGYQVDKECEYLHAPLVKGFVVSSVLPRNSVDGADALLKCFLKRGNMPVADRKHLERSGRPMAVDIKPRWAQPF